MVSKPVILIDIERHTTTYYPSITEASVDSGFSRQTLIRARDSRSGKIPGTDPPIYIDEAVFKEDPDE